MRRKFNTDLNNWLLENAKHYTITELIAIAENKFNEHFDKKQLAQYLIHKHIEYKHVAPKKSHSNNPTPIGSITTKTDGGIQKVKVAPHKWVYKQRLVYEQHYGAKLPEDVYVVFLDQNKNNFDINNLKAIKRRESAIMAHEGLFSHNNEITKLGHITAKLKIKCSDILNKDTFE